MASTSHRERPRSSRYLPHPAVYSLFGSLKRMPINTIKTLHHCLNILCKLAATTTKTTPRLVQLTTCYVAIIAILSIRNVSPAQAHHNTLSRSSSWSFRSCRHSCLTVCLPVSQSVLLRIWRSLFAQLPIENQSIKTP